MHNHIEKIEDLGKSKIEKLKVYADQLVKWQKKYNLVSNSTLPDIWNRHMLDSLQVSNYIQKYKIEDKKKLIITDLGSGAGFPGMVLAIMCVGCLLYTSPSPRDATLSRMPSSA